MSGAFPPHPLGERSVHSRAEQLNSPKNYLWDTILARKLIDLLQSLPQVMQEINATEADRAIIERALRHLGGMLDVKVNYTVTAKSGQDRSVAGVRMDKWLWAARFFKTRAQAARACELGRIQANGQLAKAAREVRAGDSLRVTNASGEFEIQVLLLSEVRGPAQVAQTLYRETEASRELRLKVAAERKAMRQFEELPAGRPSKRDRRRIIQFRGRI